MISSTSFLTRPGFGHPTTQAHFSDVAICSSMVAFEKALALAQGALGQIPEEAAVAISQLRGTEDVSITALEDGVRTAGVPVPALVAMLRGMLKDEHADWLHFGATSQDVVDTAFCLCAGAALDDLFSQLRDLIAELKAQSEIHSGTIMVARTRGQLATPITFGLRIAQWAQPLIALEAELANLRAIALRVQFGGASGSRSAVSNCADVSQHMAQQLGLADGPPWHTDRTGLRRLANWLARLVQALAKIGYDLSLSARGEIAEISAGTLGGSSTMPHKSNPVLAEALQSLAPIALACETGLSAAAVHGEERDGVHWPVEWALIPSLFETAGAALAHTTGLVTTITVNTDRMKARVVDMPDVMAEAAVFALARKIGRIHATQKVNAALLAGTSLPQLVDSVGELDSNAIFSDHAFTEPARQVAEQIFAARGQVASD